MATSTSPARPGAATSDAAPARAGPAWGRIALIALAVAALSAMWRYTPLHDYLTPQRVFDWAQSFGERWWAPLAVIVAYSPACITMFPRPLITLFAVIAFGPWLGFAYGITGILLAAAMTYVAGARMPEATVRRLAGPRLDGITEVLRRRGLIASFATHVVPVGPFAVVGFVSGNIGIKFFDYLAGTFLGMAPGALVTTVFGDQLQAALEDSRINWWLVGGVAVVFAIMMVFVRRWFAKEQKAGRSRHKRAAGPTRQETAT
jgi:uncharacterized membrane protein YdjX (TVP38/TMEM64 family)